MRDSYTDRSLNLTLPRLPFDNSPLTPRKKTNCSFINNHKSYLKTKGYSIGDVYSLKRSRFSDGHKQESIQNDHNMTLINPVGSNIELPPIYGERDRKLQRNRGLTHRKEQSDVWKPQESRRYRNRHYSMIDLDRERVIPGHVKPNEAEGNVLGKVLTRTRLMQLLEEEKQNLPPDFYMDYFLTPRTDVHNSVS